MCGIAGFIDFSGHDRGEALARVKLMADAIVHRGPDEEGLFADANAALGHRRLSIIDLSSGQQPMSVLGGAVQIVFNGEIYNFKDVRARLEQAGHRFVTHSDTEVILWSYVEWGERCVEHLNGMFAFAVWDARSKSVFLARDRVGKKPLYYTRIGDVLAFASELKSLRAGGLCPDDVDPTALDCYFTFGYIPSPRTIYSSVKKLPAAHTLIATQSGARERQYWRLSFGSPLHRPMDQVVDEFESLLDEAVKCRLMSEVPLGAFLSGGLDSSLVVSSMARLMGRPVLTHSIGFDDREFNELGAARSIASHLGTEHREFVVEPRATDVLEKIAWHFDEPLADSSALPTWYVCEMTRKSVTVALSGDGGDESFGGYTFRYLPHMMESRLRAAIPTALRTTLFGPLGAAWPASARLPKPLRLKTIFENLALGDAEAFYRDLAWLRPDDRQRVYGQAFGKSLQGFTPFEAVQPFYSHSDATDALGRSQFTDISFYMTDDVLAKVDRMSMAHALEVRSPLLDYRILEFAARLPSRLKIQGGQGKMPLRLLARRRLPEAIERLPKKGFSIPAARWLRGELREMAADVIFSGNGIVSSVLDATALKKIWVDHQKGVRDHSVFLWGVMMLGLWEKMAVINRRIA